LRSELLAGLEETDHAGRGHLSAEASEFMRPCALLHLRVRPRSIFVEQEEEAVNMVLFGVAEFQLGDGFPLGIILGRHVAVTPREDSHIDIATADIFEALVEWPLVGSDVMLHRNNVVFQLAQGVVNRLAALYEVVVGCGDVNSCHVGFPW
jgi:hypothetical protein